MAYVRKEIMTGLTETYAALQEIADAVRRNDGAAYLNGCVQARAVGCTDEQIRDAYDHHNQQRLERGLNMTSFTRAGEHDYQRMQVERLGEVASYGLRLDNNGHGDGWMRTHRMVITPNQCKAIKELLGVSHGQT